MPDAIDEKLAVIKFQFVPAEDSAQKIAAFNEELMRKQMEAEESLRAKQVETVSKLIEEYRKMDAASGDMMEKRLKALHDELDLQGKIKTTRTEADAALGEAHGQGTKDTKAYKKVLEGVGGELEKIKKADMGKMGGFGNVLGEVSKLEGTLGKVGGIVGWIAVGFMEAAKQLDAVQKAAQKVYQTEIEMSAAAGEFGVAFGQAMRPVTYDVMELTGLKKEEVQRAAADFGRMGAAQEVHPSMGMGPDDLAEARAVHVGQLTVQANAISKAMDINLQTLMSWTAGIKHVNEVGTEEAMSLIAGVGQRGQELQDKDMITRSKYMDSVNKVWEINKGLGGSIEDAAKYVESWSKAIQRGTISEQQIAQVGRMGAEVNLGTSAALQQMPGFMKAMQDEMRKNPELQKEFGGVTGRGREMEFGMRWQTLWADPSLNEKALGSMTNVMKNTLMGLSGVTGSELAGRGFSKEPEEKQREMMDRLTTGITMWSKTLTGAQIPRETAVLMAKEWTGMAETTTGEATKNFQAAIKASADPINQVKENTKDLVPMLDRIRIKAEEATEYLRIQASNLDNKVAAREARSVSSTIQKTGGVVHGQFGGLVSGRQTMEVAEAGPEMIMPADVTARYSRELGAMMTGSQPARVRLAGGGGADPTYGHASNAGEGGGYGGALNVNVSIGSDLSTPDQIADRVASRVRDEVVDHLRRQAVSSATSFLASK